MAGAGCFSHIQDQSGLVSILVQPLGIFFWGFSNGYGSKNRYHNGTLVSGNMEQNLRSPSCLILSHTQITYGGWFPVTTIWGVHHLEDVTFMNLAMALEPGSRITDGCARLFVKPNKCEPLSTAFMLEGLVVEWILR